ncbi:hypothetical protein DFH09DRAFT_1088701 [Mycena vulgaris]|nr:hypothetical protein DFH09DRAFT_1088701 [Mycena vulgaris]
MLKGNSFLLKRLPQLIETTQDSQLRWRYYFPIRGLYYRSELHLEVNFYEAAAKYYHVNQRNTPKAMEFIDYALAIVENTNNTLLKMRAFYRKCTIAQSLDMQLVINLVHESKISKALPSLLQARFILLEATASQALGNHLRALLLCTRANEPLVATGLDNSDLDLKILDIRTVNYWQKSEKTSPNRSPHYHANALAILAYLDITMSSDEAGILRNLNGAQELYKTLRSRRILLCSLVTAELYLYRGDTENARMRLQECFSTCRSIYPDLAIDCLAALGDIRHRMHSQTETFHWAMVYFYFVLKAKDRVATFRALRCLADIYNEADDKETAFNLYCTALEAATEMDIHRLRAECMTGIGDIMLSHGDSVQAKEMWKAAHPLFVKSSQMKDAAAIDARLARLSDHPALDGDNVNSPRIAGPEDTSPVDLDAVRKLSQLARLPTSEIQPGLEANSLEEYEGPIKMPVFL